jgi:hypothetical protein
LYVKPCLRSQTLRPLRLTRMRRSSCSRATISFSVMPFCASIRPTIRLHAHQVPRRACARFCEAASHPAWHARPTGWGSTPIRQTVLLHPGPKARLGTPSRRVHANLCSELGPSKSPPSLESLNQNWPEPSHHNRFIEAWTCSRKAIHAFAGRRYVSVPGSPALVRLMASALRRSTPFPTLAESRSHHRPPAKRGICP